MDHDALVDRFNSALEVLQEMRPLLLNPPQETEDNTEYDVTDVLRIQAITLDFLLSLASYILDKDHPEENRQ